MIESKKEDLLVLEESGDNVFINISNTIKDILTMFLTMYFFRFITVNIFSETSSKVNS